MIIQQLFLVTFHSPPSFTISGIKNSEKDHVHYQVFLDKAEAQAWVKSQKNTNSRKFRVTLLSPKTIKSLWFTSGNGFIEISLEGPGSLFNDFKPRNFPCQIRTYKENILKVITTFSQNDTCNFSALNRLKNIIPSGSTLADYQA